MNYCTICGRDLPGRNLVPCTYRWCPYERIAPPIWWVFPLIVVVWFGLIGAGIWAWLLLSALFEAVH